MKIGTMIFASPTNNSFLSQVLENVGNDKDFDVRVKPQLSSTICSVVETTSRIAYYRGLIAFAFRGEVAERLNAPVLKTGIG